MKKILFLFFLIFSFYVFGDDIKEPQDPDNPVVVGDNSETGKTELKFNIEYQKQNRIFGKGIFKAPSNVYLNLSWQGNEEGTQQILIDFIKSIRVQGYTMVKKERSNLGVIFYFPYVFDIELNDGKIIKGAKGRINELESFVVYNKIGREKCYTYFVRYWLEDKQVFSDNMSSDYNENPPVPKNVVIYIEFNQE